MTPPLSRRAAAEAAGTGLLLAAVVGSGIMAERLAAGNAAVALLANAIATGCALFALIITFAPVSGAHFNPVVSLARTLAGDMPTGTLLPFIAAQVAGAIAGVWIAHLMFGLPILQASVHARDGIGQWAGEFVATFGLVLLIESGVRSFPERLPAAVAAYITAAYWFTSSTSFANPAVTIARALTDTFAGISPAHVPAFIASQLLGALAAIAFSRWLAAEA
ncbi:MAG TPA: aquaporin [Alphaproteobacteria bacterium]|nr:aquaporin [Alphaproteobacteria bacterium]